MWSWGRSWVSSGRGEDDIDCLLWVLVPLDFPLVHYCTHLCITEPLVHMTERKLEKRVCFSVNRLKAQNCDYLDVWYFVWYLFHLVDMNGCCTLFLWPLLQTSSSCLRPQILLSEGSRGQTSDCTPKLCPWQTTATGRHVSGNIRYKVHTIIVMLTCTGAKLSFWLLQGFIPMVVPDMLKGAVFVSRSLCHLFLV